MKRLIKFHSPYTSDGIQFSNCSTKYSILPELVEDNADSKQLRILAVKYKLKLVGKIIKYKEEKYNRRTSLKITHAIKTDKTIKSKWNNDEEHQEYIGFITLPNDEFLPMIKSIDNKMTLEQANKIVEQNVHGISAVGETVDNKIVLVKEGWNYFHEIPLLGYDLKYFEEIMNIDEHGFEDDTYSCHNCGLYDSSDNGYENNHRVVNDCELLGINCGCFDEFNQSDEALEHYKDNPNDPMTLDSAEKLKKKKKIKFIERFIGGMVDGRGGSYGGEYCREGHPKEILKELKNDNPDKHYLFSMDECGQFQTYFSVWEIK